MRKWINLCETEGDRLEALHAELQLRSGDKNALEVHDVIRTPIWLAHFSFDAEQIASQGFTQGSPLHVDWVFTNGPDYSEAGYNFAIDIQDENDISFWGVHAMQAAIFKAPGIRTYHYDGFHQIIFWGPDVVRPIYVIECIDASMGEPSEHDWKIIQVNNEKIDGPAMPLYDLLAHIESGGSNYQ